MSLFRRPALALASLAFLAPALAEDLVVAPAGGDFDSIQAALDAAGPGDRVLVREKPGGWIEQLVFPQGGSAVGGWLELVAFPGETPALDGTGLGNDWMIEITDRSWIRIEGLIIRNNLDTQGDGSGIRLQGAGSHYEFVGNTIHDMRGDDAMAITVYGTSTAGSIRDLLIEGNLVYDCEPSQSEAITLNGNVEQFEVLGNRVQDVNNIGIDFIGGEASINPNFVARDGVVRGNVVLRANSNYGGGYAAGIYVDGGKDILIEGNYVAGCDLGIEVGAENNGVDSSGVVVRNNIVVANDKAGLVFGGYDASVGRVRDCAFTNNLFYTNDTQTTGVGEVWVQFAEDCELRNNLIVAGSQSVWIYSDSATSGIQFDTNLYAVPSGQGEIGWAGAYYVGLAAWQAGSGQDALSMVADPLFLDPDGADGVLGSVDDDFRLQAGSPAIDAGDNGALAATVQMDFQGGPRFASDPFTTAPLGLGLAPLVDRGPLEYVAPMDPVLRYCETSANSAGSGSWMGWSGGLSVAANAFQLEARGLPALQFGLFFMGPAVAQQPSGNGQLCVGGGLLRFSVVASDAQGAASDPVDFSTAPAAGAIVSGSGWRFQHWTRDSVGSGWNFSDGLLVTFQP